jgi:hypothetical protein
MGQTAREIWAESLTAMRYVKGVGGQASPGRRSLETGRMQCAARRTINARRLV